MVIYNHNLTIYGYFQLRLCQENPKLWKGLGKSYRSKKLSSNMRFFGNLECFSVMDPRTNLESFYEFVAILEHKKTILENENIL